MRIRSLLLATALALTATPVLASARSAPAAAAGFAADAWNQVYRHDFGDLHDLQLFHSTATANSSLLPSDTSNSSLQKPTVSSDVLVADDPAAEDGKALAVWTRQADYPTSIGTAYGWTNGRISLLGQSQSPPVRIRARLRFTPSIKTKTSVMWWPKYGWPWEVDFAETFGGSTLTDYWGGRQHISERWHGDGPDADLKANEQIIYNMSLDGTLYHTYDLFITPYRMSIEVDGVEMFATTNRQYIPYGPGDFGIGKGLTDSRDAPDRTDDTVFLDSLEIYKSETVAPAAPVGLTAVGSSSGVNLGWTANTETDLAGYNVYRAADPAGTYTLLNTARLVTGVTFSDLTAPSGVASYYKISAVDAVGNESVRSDPADTVRPDTTPPAAPVGLTATGSAAGIDLAWTPNTEPDLAGYNVYRATDPAGSYSQVNTGGPVGQASYSDSTAPSGVASYYEVRAVDTAGNESARSNPASASPADTTPPAAPVGLAATGSSTGIKLTWTANTEPDLAGYNVYRSADPVGTYSLVNTGGPVSQASYSDSGAPTGVASYYKVSAVDTARNESARSDAAGATPVDTTAPGAPAGLAAAGSSSGVDLGWTANTEPDLAGYNVYRSADPAGTYSLVNTGGLVSRVSYSDSGAPIGVTSYYKVSAVDIAGNESVRSITASASPADTTPPAAPVGLAATGSSTGIKLTWTANTEPDLAGYNVYRATDPTGSYSLVNTGGPVSGTSYGDAAASSGIASYYKVSAVDTARNESVRSDPAGATRPPPTPTKYEEAAATYYGTWAQKSDSRFSGGKSTYSKLQASKAVFYFTGSSVSWITSSGPLRGTAKIWYDGVYRGRVNLYSSNYGFQLVGWTSPVGIGKHKLVLYVAENKRVDVDGFSVAP